MADQKISQLTTIATVDNATDLFPIVDTSVGETKKITPTALKSALALNNVDNTTDANKPVSTATQTALGLKQDTLVSATNIKTINSTTLLGSGNIVVGATPSGVAGAIQFSDGTAFSSDATNLFYDDTNNRLGIGTNTPASALSVVQTIALSAGATNPRIENIGYTINNSGAQTGTATGIFLNATETNLNGQTHNLIDLQVGGTSKAKINSLGSLTLGNSLTVGSSSAHYLQLGAGLVLRSPSDGVTTFLNSGESTFNRINLGGTTSSFPAIKRALNNIEIKNADDTYGAGFSVGAALNTSAILQADSTTKGFLLPRMTTTQKNAIASPAAGLMVYDTTLNKLCVRTASTWETITSS